MDQPLGFDAKGQELKVCRLKRSIYGVKQTSKQWNIRFHNSITSFGFEMIEEYQYVHFKKYGKSILIHFRYVDDILIVRNDKTSIETMKAWLSSHFEMTDMGEAHYGSVN
ncbi:hypothetical protein ACFX1S_009216 [Malus domestica]